VELFVSLAYSVTLKTCHGWRVTPGRTESNGKRDGAERGVLLSATVTSAAA
jgi:hypothetical protein